MAKIFNKLPGCFEVGCRVAKDLLISVPCKESPFTDKRRQRFFPDFEEEIHEGLETEISVVVLTGIQGGWIIFLQSSNPQGIIALFLNPKSRTQAFLNSSAVSSAVSSAAESST